jgi:hypothetical protein
VRRLWGACVAASLTVAIAAPTAGAAATRADYVAQAEPICKRAKEKANRIAKRLSTRTLKKLVEGDDFEKFERLLAKLTGRANKPFGKMIKRLHEVQPAPGDEIAVAQWLDGLGDYKRLTDRYVRSASRGKLGRAARFQIDAVNALVGGARFVNGFDFKHCPGGEVITDETGFAARP